MPKKDALLRKALAVAVDQGDSDISSYLPAPLATEVIEYVRDVNVLRKILNTFTMTTRTWKKPKRSSGMSAYFIPDGVQATESGFTSTSLEWVAKKLMSYTVIDEEAVEDSQPDVVSQILKDFADAVGEAEEKAMLDGDTTHLATAPDPTSATSSNWFVKDARLAFKGIFTAAAEVGVAATKVDAASGAFDVNQVNEAIYNLGKYGRNKRNLIGLVPSLQAANVRANADFNDASKAGLALATYISGMNSAGETPDGFLTVIFGVKFFEAPQTSNTDQIAIFNKTSPEIGDRRRIKVASGLVIEQDQRKYVISERIAFNFNYQAAMVIIDSLSTAMVS
jgi:hypothetical protein